MRKIERNRKIDVRLACVSLWSGQKYSYHIKMIQFWKKDINTLRREKWPRIHVIFLARVRMNAGITDC
jgi:hypothetical protein